MTIALDATYSTGDALSGVGIYSREILHGHGGEAETRPDHGDPRFRRDDALEEGLRRRGKRAARETTP